MLTIHSSGYLTRKESYSPTSARSGRLNCRGLRPLTSTSLAFKIIFKNNRKVNQKKHPDKRQGGRSSNTVSVQDDLFDS